MICSVSLQSIFFIKILVLNIHYVDKLEFLRYNYNVD